MKPLYIAGLRGLGPRQSLRSLPRAPQEVQAARGQQDGAEDGHEVGEAPEETQAGQISPAEVLVELDAHRAGVAERIGYIDGKHRRAGEAGGSDQPVKQHRDRKSTRLNSSHLGISYAVF